MTTVSAREFNQDVSGAKRAADEGPVVITDRGEPAYVLLSIADYEQMRDRRSLLDALQMDDDVEFEPVGLMEQIHVTTYRNIAYYRLLLDSVRGAIDNGPLTIAA